jgi:predicted DNA-binding WGR domain protein
LDAFERALENEAMENAEKIADHKLQMLVFERRDRKCNMARFYVLAIEPTLFGDRALVREWGRIGFPGRRRLDLYANSKMAAEALEIWLMRKSRRGYCVRT